MVNLNYSYRPDNKIEDNIRWSEILKWGEYPYLWM